MSMTCQGATALAGGFRARAGNFFALAVRSHRTVLFGRFSDAVMHQNTTNPHKQLCNEAIRKSATSTVGRLCTASAKKLSDVLQNSPQVL
jgi:hypothetical protein